MSLAPPEEELASIEALDFEVEVPCETRPEWHDVHGDGPAQWAFRQRCPGCGFIDLLLVCDGCLKAILAVPGLTCVFCGHAGPIASFTSNLTPIHRH